MPRSVQGLHGLRHLAELPSGCDLGTTHAITITQQMIQQFADATGDQQWIHTDVERAKNESPFGGPVAHGYLTVALIPRLLPELIDVQGVSGALNYGCEKVRFPAPVPAGASVRLSATLAKTRDVGENVQATFEIKFHVEGEEKPACVATVLYLYLD